MRYEAVHSRVAPIELIDCRTASRQQLGASLSSDLIFANGGAGAMKYTMRLYRTLLGNRA